MTKKDNIYNYFEGKINDENPKANGFESTKPQNEKAERNLYNDRINDIDKEMNRRDSYQGIKYNKKSA